MKKEKRLNGMNKGKTSGVRRLTLLLLSAVMVFSIGAILGYNLVLSNKVKQGTESSKVIEEAEAGTNQIITFATMSEGDTRGQNDGVKFYNWTDDTTPAEETASGYGEAKMLSFKVTSNSFQNTGYASQTTGGKSGEYALGGKIGHASETTRMAICGSYQGLDNVSQNYNNVLINGRTIYAWNGNNKTTKENKRNVSLGVMWGSESGYKYWFYLTITFHNPNVIRNLGQNGVGEIARTIEFLPDFCVAACSMGYRSGWVTELNAGLSLSTIKTVGSSTYTKDYGLNIGHYGIIGAVTKQTQARTITLPLAEMNSANASQKITKSGTTSNESTQYGRVAYVANFSGVSNYGSQGQAFTIMLQPVGTLLGMGHSSNLYTGRHLTSNNAILYAVDSAALNSPSNTFKYTYPGYTQLNATSNSTEISTMLYYDLDNLSLGKKKTNELSVPATPSVTDKEYGLKVALTWAMAHPSQTVSAISSSVDYNGSNAATVTYTITAQDNFTVIITGLRYTRNGASSETMYDPKCATPSVSGSTNVISLNLNTSAGASDPSGYRQIRTLQATGSGTNYSVQIQLKITQAAWSGLWSFDYRITDSNYYYNASTDSSMFSDGVGSGRGWEDASSYATGSFSATVDLQVKSKINLNASANGGASNQTAYQKYNTLLSLSRYTASKSGGWNFVGWNGTQSATSGQSSITPSGNEHTVYAIFSKALTAKVYNNSTTATTISVTIYNNATSGTATLPAQANRDRWNKIGWRTDGTATTASDTNTASHGITITTSNTGTLSYYAVYSAQVSVEYDTKTNGGSGTVSATNGTRYYNSAGNTANPTITLAGTTGVSKSGGWNVVGWNTNKDATTKITSISNVDSNKTVYAIYSKTLKATYYSTSESTAQGSNSVTIYNNVTSGKITTLTPTSQGDWDPLGWRTDTSATTASYSSGASVSISGDTTFRAVYSRTHTLSYNSNGGSGSIANQTSAQYRNVTTNSSVSYTLSNGSGFSKTGHTFSKWAAGSTSGTQYSAGASYSTSGDNVTMYAIWNVNQYTVTYKAKTNGGTTADQTAKVNYGAKVDLSKTAEKSGWKLVGWNTNKDATSELSSYTMPANDVTLYAIYSKTLTATYYSTSESTAQGSNSVTIYNNATSGKITTLTPTSQSGGWDTLGWRTDTSATTASYSSGASVSISGDTTFRAVYSRTHTLSYNSNGGSGSIANQTSAQYRNVTTNSSVSYTLSNGSGFSKNGYKLLKWRLESITGAEYALGGTYSTSGDNATMIAEWSIETYYITYNGVAGTDFSGVTEYTVETDTFSILIPCQIKLVITEYTVETDTFSISNPYKNGYMFNGWSAVTSGNLKIADPFNVSVPKGTYGNITFTANFGEFYLNATTNEGALTLEVVGGVDGNGYKYQFWMEGNSEYGSRYELVSENYQTSNSVTIASPASYQINGYYSAYVRVKLGNDIVAEFAGRYDISELHLGYKEIYVNNDRVLDTVYVSIEDGATIKVVVPSNSADKLEYSDGQTSGNTTTLVDGEYFEFNYKPSTAGYYKLKLTLSVNGTNRSSFYLNVVAFSEDSVYLTNTGYTVSGDTVTLNASMTTLGNATTKGYWIDYVVANGQRTANANAYKLRESGLYPYYIWLYGPNGTADWVEGIINYNAPSMSISVPSTEVGSSVVATASEVENAVRYWFRVYDASGLWTIQRTSSNSCTYTFSKAGIYRLEVMAESKSGIYISSSSIDVRVTGASVSNLSIDAPSSVNTFDVVNINALLSNVEDSDKTIYKYVIRGMNKYEELTPYYTTSSNRQHVFTKPGTYTIEVRIMHKDSYGMYDATAYHTITVS